MFVLLFSTVFFLCLVERLKGVDLSSSVSMFVTGC